MWGYCYPSIAWEHEYVADKSNIVLFLHTILRQHVFQLTRFRDGVEPRLLDLIFTNDEGLVNDLTNNAALGNSDHECLSFTLDCYKEVQFTVKKQIIELSGSDFRKWIGYQNYMGTSQQGISIISKSLKMQWKGASLRTAMKEKRKICKATFVICQI